MNIETYNQIDFKSFNFINTSYREYLAINDNMIIGVYPFSTNFYKILVKNQIEEEKQNPVQEIKALFDKLTYYEYKFKDKRFLNFILSVHHNNYNEKDDIKIDPCKTYELVSGCRIHHNEMDILYDESFYCYNRKLFNSEIISHLIDNKINKLLEESSTIKVE